jgi:alcohol dehydrogenase class IV
MVDPELTYDLPAEITASTGLDALTQLIEAFVSCRANPFTDALCRDGIALAASALPTAYEHASLASDSPEKFRSDYREARGSMALASLFSGIALANAGLGAVHGFAGPLGGMFAAPHGAVCAALLPETMLANIDALRRREPNNPALSRYTEIAQILHRRPEASAEEGAEWVRRLCLKLEIPRLGRHGVTPADGSVLVANARRASSMKGNPVSLTEEELTALLLRCL